MKKDKPHVVTLFSENVPDPEAAKRRLEAWKKNWSAQGYEPVVLLDTRALRDRTVSYFVNRLAGRNTNPPTFLKWFAAAVACPANEYVLLADYNVFNYGFIPEMSAGRIVSSGKCVLFSPPSSDVVFASKLALLHQSEMLCHYVPADGDRYSDVDVLAHQKRNIPDRIAEFDVCRPHGDLTDWETATLVRFSDLSADPETLRSWTQTNAVAYNPEHA